MKRSTLVASMVCLVAVFAMMAAWGGSMERMAGISADMTMAWGDVGDNKSRHEIAVRGHQGKRGTAADFVRMFPWMVVGFVSMMFALLAWFVKRYDDARESKIDRTISEISKTNKTMGDITRKLDATINTLVAQDRDIEHNVSTLAAAVAGIRATCEARGRMCPLSGSKMYCLERRDGEDRRDEDDNS